MNFRM